MQNARTKKRRAKIIGGCDERPLIIADNGDGTVHVIPGKKMKSGEPLDPGSSLFTLSKGERDDELVLETIVDRSGAGPAQVASPAYRRGYDATFKKKPEKPN